MALSGSGAANEYVEGLRLEGAGVVAGEAARTTDQTAKPPCDKAPTINLEACALAFMASAAEDPPP